MYPNSIAGYAGDEAIPNELIDAQVDGYESGVADERARHEPRKWDTMPDVEGWYWFDGKTAGPRHIVTNEPDYWYDTRIMVCFEGDRCYSKDDVYTEADITGTWYGPLVPPWDTD